MIARSPATLRQRMTGDNQDFKRQRRQSGDRSGPGGVWPSKRKARKKPLKWFSHACPEMLVLTGGADVGVAEQYLYDRGWKLFLQRHLEDALSFAREQAARPGVDRRDEGPSIIWNVHRRRKSLMQPRMNSCDGLEEIEVVA